MFQSLKDKSNSIAIIGLGYVGLPIALEFAKKFKVIGFDINADRIALMQQHIDPSNEMGKEDFEGCDITFTANLEVLRTATFFIVAVPTPVDKHKVPDLKPLIGASTTLGKILKKGDYVVYESTVYPGCTEEDCVPIIEQISGHKAIEDFKYGYSPERINPGDKVNTLTKITKIVSGCDAESLDTIAAVYEAIITAGIHRASSVKVAEAAKIIENTQRDLNIALMNELSLIFDRMGINTYDVVEAAGTKWNFQRFYPGLVGGHCIGVDPYYLTYKSIALGYEPQIILSGRRINDEMSTYVAKKVVQMMIRAGKSITNTKVLIMGVTFKENVSDIRNSKVADLYKELCSYSVQVDATDPYANSDELMHEYGFGLTQKIAKNYDAIIVAVNHDEYKNLDEEYFVNITNNNAVLVDIKNMYRGKINKLRYWTL
jgi:UDP-N-acetyl-D-galactosamine dehydrogenase